MKFPWVSRDRLEEVQKRLDASEAERKVLLDRIAMMHGEPPIYAKPEPVQVVRVAPEPEPVQVAVGQPKPHPQRTVVAGSVTADHILKAAAEAVKNGTVGQHTRMN